jgi:hypothetical protein
MNEGKMVTVTLNGKYSDIQLKPQNGEPERRQVNIQLDESLASLRYRPDDVQLVIPCKFAALFLVGHPIRIALRQNADCVPVLQAHCLSLGTEGARSPAIQPGPTIC